MLLLTVAPGCQAPPVLRHCTSKLTAEPCSHARVASVAATLSILRPRGRCAAAGRAQRGGSSTRGAGAGATCSRSAARLRHCSASTAARQQHKKTPKPTNITMAPAAALPPPFFLPPPPAAYRTVAHTNG